MRRGTGRIKEAMKKQLDRMIAYFTGRAEDLPHEAEQYWSDSQRDERLRDYSHWLGHGRWADEKRWFGIGDNSRRLLDQARRIVNEDRPNHCMLEWGQGGGANAVHFSSDVNTYYGVDIAQANLDECARQFQVRGLKNFCPILIDADQPEDVVQQIEDPIDVFLSTAVFQHFPSKEYGQRVIKVVSRILRERAIGLIQIRYDNGDERFVSKNRNYRKNAITFTSYQVDEFWELLAESGLDPLNVVLSPKHNYATYLFEKPLASSQNASALTS